MRKLAAIRIVGIASLFLILSGCDSYLVGSSSSDTGISEAGALDTGAPDTGALDTGAPDTGAPDTGAPDTGAPDTGAPDTGAPDTGAPDLSAPAPDGTVDSTADASVPVGDGTVDSTADASVPVGDGTVDSTEDASVPVGDGTVDSTEDGSGPVQDSSVDGSGAVVFMAGVNLSCAEFGGSLPGTFGTDYTYPTQAEVDYFVGKGMNIFRLPFRWERLQQQANGSFDAAELIRIEDFVDYATGLGAYVLLDPHNYARYYDQLIGQGVATSAFADFWTKLANHFKSNDLVIFGLMNEPHDMTTELWRDDANAAIQAIRDTGATNLILVPGNGWTGAHSWSSTYYGTANSVVMQTIVDPGNNFAFEVHQYFDSDSSGTSDTCVSAQVGEDRIKDFTTWLKQHGYKGFLGEFGIADNTTCTQAMDNMLSYIDANKDVWIGWTYWAAGPWWGSYMFSIEPSGGQDAPQMATLVNHL